MEILMETQRRLSLRDSSVPSESVASREPWNGSAYLANSGDMLCSVEGEQNIETYSIGFGAPGSFNESNLFKCRVAEGGGSYHYASDVGGLDEAFSTIIQDIVDRSAVVLFFACGTTRRHFTGKFYVRVFLSA